MRNLRWIGTRAALVIAAVLVAAPAMPAAHARNLTVFAAASLKEALDAVAAQYRQRYGGRASIAYAASSTLAKQIENGAPADIFISADLDWMDYLAKRNLLKAGSRVNLLRNELVLVAPASSTVKVDIKRGFPLAALLGKDRLAMADPDAVPAGKYGKASLQALDVWPSVVDRIARAENVRAALVFVSRGETPLGIVYRTDALAERSVRIVGTFRANTHPPIVYPAALLVGGKSPEAARFFAYMTSSAAAQVFRRYGFMPY